MLNKQSGGISSCLSDSLCPCCLHFEATRSGNGHSRFDSRFSRHLFAGINAKLVTACCAIGIALMPLLWTMLHDYQRERILTLIDPTLDPLGKGFHTLQALIAIGSGGFPVKGGWRGTQAHLDFIPERTSDFIFCGFRRRVWFSLVGCFCSSYISVSLPEALHRRSCTISLRSTLAAAIGVIFFTYSFVNIGMVSGIPTCSGSSTAFYELRWF